MRFEEAARRLAALGDAERGQLPRPPGALEPVRISGDERLRVRLGPGGLREAAVLVLVHPDGAGDARVVLIERPTYEGFHSGEVSLPGGKAEPGDRDLVATALREAAEEVGLDPSASGLSVVGRLDPVHVTVSGFAVHPVVALAARTPDLVPHPGEVARIVSAPVDAFLPDAPMPIVERRVRDWMLRYGIYPVEGLEVWGATARILGQLGAILAKE
ncbi:MAG TPA: CoA pyrophosphatase [Candidatus Limnocylindrales bacterium]